MILSKNWNLRTAKAGILSAVALLSIAGGLVSCEFEGGQPAGENEEQEEENEGNPNNPQQEGDDND